LVHEDDPSCPLCEQNLSASRKRFLKLNFAKQESSLTHRLRRLKRIIPALKEILIAQHTAINQDKEQLQHAVKITLKIDELKTARAKIAQQITELTATCIQQRTDIAAHANIITTKQQHIAEQSTYIQKIDNPL